MASLYPLCGYTIALVAHVEDARAVLHELHIAKLGTKVVDDVRRREQVQ